MNEPKLDINSIFAAMKPPTPEEHRAASLSWLARVGPTLIDQWPADVLALSAPTIFVPAPMETMRGLFGDQGSWRPGAAELAAELDGHMGWKRRFFRLNSRSPKDATWPFKLPVTCSGREVLSVMGASERVLDDLVHLNYLPEQPAFICLREFDHRIRPSDEYRCFVRDGDLVAVTHYDYTNPIGAPLDGGQAIRARIDAYFTETLKPRLHIATVVFDVALSYDGAVILIELNPYGMSDPCWLGSYAGVEAFEGYVAFAPIEAAEATTTASDGEVQRSGTTDPKDLITEQAAEIERLRAQVQSAVEDAQAVWGGELAALTAERDALARRVDELTTTVALAVTVALAARALASEPDTEET